MYERSWFCNNTDHNSGGHSGKNWSFAQIPVMMVIWKIYLTSKEMHSLKFWAVSILNALNVNWFLKWCVRACLCIFMVVLQECMRESVLSLLNYFSGHYLTSVFVWGSFSLIWILPCKQGQWAPGFTGFFYLLMSLETGTIPIWSF